MRERGKPAMRRQTWPLPARLEPGCQKDGAMHCGEQHAGMAEEAQTLPSRDMETKTAILGHERTGAEYASRRRVEEPLSCTNPFYTSNRIEADFEPESQPSR